MADLEHPAWSPNGAWISFNIPPEGPNPAVMVVHPNGEGLRALRRSDASYGLFNAVWSPDGRKILVGCHDFATGIDRLCVMDADGHGLQVVVDGPPSVNLPAWGTYPLQR